MRPSRWYPIPGLAALVAVASALWAEQPRETPQAPQAPPAKQALPAKQAPPAKLPPGKQATQAQRTPHIGYVYPAGGRQGNTFQVTVGGQFLDGVNDVHISGTGASATVVEYVKPMPVQQANQLRDQLMELMARRAAALGLPAPAAAQKAASTASRTATAASTATSSATRTPTAASTSASTATPTSASTPTRSSGEPGPQGPAQPAPKPTWTADDEAIVADIRKRLATFVRRPSSVAIAEAVTLEVTLAADAQVGRRELRLATALGLTNPLVFRVGQLPEFAAKPVRFAAEPTRSVPKDEMNITLPATVNGQIMPGGVDRYRFQARQGQRLVVAASARELVPYLADAVPGWFQATLTLYDARGNELAYDDDFRFNPDPVLYCVIPRDGGYAIEIKDAIYRGREDFVYRISLGELPLVTGIFPLGGRAGAETAVDVQGWNLPAATLTMDARDKAPGIYPLSARAAALVSNSVPFAVDTLPECLEQEPNSQPAGAQRIALPIIVNGRIDQPGDADLFRFEGRRGDEIVAEIHARRLNSPLDSVLKLTDAAGKVLALNDDHEDKGSGLNTHHADSYLRATLPEDGTYYIHVGDVQRKGGPEYAYRLRVSPPQPDFELRAAPASLSVRPGTAAPLTIYALRRDGFSGQIAVALKGAPPGCALSGGPVPADKDKAEFTLTVRPITPKGLLALRLEGRAMIQGREVVRPVVPAEDMMQAFAYRHLVPAQELLVAVRPTRPAGGVMAQPAAEPRGGGVGSAK